MSPAPSPSLRLLPGLGLSLAVAGLAIVVQWAEFAVFGHHWFESLALAILIGAVVASVRPLSATFRPGIVFGAKPVLEVAIVLLGASVDVSALSDAGGALVGGVAVVVIVALASGYGIGRLMGLTPVLAVLVASGNAICGNSAIAAAAPVVEAQSDDVAAAIAFTAILGILTVVLLPLLPGLVGLDDFRYGIFAGMTVYAVPQVLAATAPVGAVAVQIGILVKLVRVMMLGPVLVLLALLRGGAARGRVSLGHMVPWFIVGFLAMMALRSFGLVGTGTAQVLAGASHGLTLIAMAALGLMVDARSLLHCGGRVAAAAALSLLTLALASTLLLALILNP